MPATSAGAYEFIGLAPGEYYVAAVSPRYASAWDDPVFLDALTAGATKIRLDSGRQRVGGAENDRSARAVMRRAGASSRARRRVCRLADLTRHDRDGRRLGHRADRHAVPAARASRHACAWRVRAPARGLSAPMAKASSCSTDCLRARSRCRHQSRDWSPRFTVRDAPAADLACWLPSKMAREFPSH